VTQWPKPGRARIGYPLTALAVLLSTGLGVTTLVEGLHSTDPNDTQPSVAIEELTPGLGSDTPKAKVPLDFDPKQANLVAAEDQRVFNIVGTVLSGTAPRELTSPGAPPTLVLPSRLSPYTLDNLVSAGAVVRQPGALLVVKNVLLAPGARLDVAVPGGQLRLSSGPSGFTSLVGFKATLELSGSDRAPLTVTSWNPATNTPDTDETDGRAYLRSIGGRMDLTDVTVADLGFWSGRTGGVAWTGSASAPATGTATGVTISGNHYGIFLARSTGVLINGAQISRSTMDGVSVHSNALGTQLWRVDTMHSGRNGIDVSAGAQQTTMRGVAATGNVRNGIYLDGTPPASGPNADGGTTRQSAVFSVDGSTSRGNSEHGILVTNANDVTLTNNTVAANRDGIIVRGVTRGVVLRANHISSPGGFAVAVRGGAKDAVVDQNVISDALTAVQVNDSVATVTNNEIADMTLHGVSLIGRSSGSSVTDNRVTGRGPSAVDTSRLAFGGVVSESGNDDTNWAIDRDDVQLISSYVRKQPLVLLWFLTLVAPLAAQMIYRKRNRWTLGQHPYAGRSPAAGAPAVPVTNAALPHVPVPRATAASTPPFRPSPVPRARPRPTPYPRPAAAPLPAPTPARVAAGPHCPVCAGQSCSASTPHTIPGHPGNDQPGNGRPGTRVTVVFPR
jgi:parallel beta-helix repeat protein